MINLTKFFLTSLLLCLIINQTYVYSQPIFVPTYNVECPNDLATTCDLQCPNGNYVLDEKGCPTCACAPNEIIPCPLRKCRANCGDGGYVLDENGCQTCQCVAKENVLCPRSMCRMYCSNGFKRDENGCEYCACNPLPQGCPLLKCQKTCTNGYRKDYSGCQTCECECPPMNCPANNCTRKYDKDVDGCSICICDEQKEILNDKCLPFDCNIQCKYGLQRDESGCPLCSCNSCSMRTCRMFCMYGFQRNEDGCEICECDWTPVLEKISCSERIPCQGTRVCNLNIGLCETVDPDRVNWFVYDFELETNIFNDQKFVQTFKNGLINNIAMKYDLATTQITVSSVEHNGLTSFQIMPFFAENMDEFDRKMDQIDIDLNSHEFRSVLPAVVSAIDDVNIKSPIKTNNIGKLCEKLKNFTRQNPKSTIFIIVFLFILTGITIVIVYINVCRRYIKHPHRSESKLPIYDTSYQPTSTDDDYYQAVHAPDGTAYVVVETDDKQSSNDKRALV